MDNERNKRSVGLIAAAMRAGAGISFTAATEPGLAGTPAVGTMVDEMPPPEPPRASNGRLITTRAQRKALAAAAHQRGIRLTANGQLRQAAAPTAHVCIDSNHIAAARREQERRRKEAHAQRVEAMEERKKAAQAAATAKRGS